MRTLSVAALTINNDPSHYQGLLGARHSLLESLVSQIILTTTKRRGREALADEETMAFLAHLVHGHFLRMFLSHLASPSAFNHK